MNKELIKVYFKIWGGPILVMILTVAQLYNIVFVWLNLNNRLEAFNAVLYMIIGTVYLIINAEWLDPFIFFLRRKRKLPYKRNDGGRSNYFNSKANDCAVRAISIATQSDYWETYLALINTIQDNTDIDIDGVKFRIIKKYLENKGWKYHGFRGKGGRINKDNPNIPKKGTFILDTPGHVTTIVDGVIQDRFNPSEMRLYGYFYKEEP